MVESGSKIFICARLKNCCVENGHPTFNKESLYWEKRTPTYYFIYFFSFSIGIFKKDAFGPAWLSTITCKVISTTPATKKLYSVVKLVKWTKSCTTKDDDYPIIYRVLTIPGGAGFLPSRKILVKMGIFPK